METEKYKSDCACIIFHSFFIYIFVHITLWTNYKLAEKPPRLRANTVSRKHPVYIATQPRTGSHYG